MYSGLPMEGAMANFSCPPGMMVNGTNTATCTENGEWKPDPQDVECISMFIRIHIVFTAVTKNILKH